MDRCPAGLARIVWREDISAASPDAFGILSVFFRQPIPNTRFGLQIGRSGGVRLQFLPKVGHVDAQVVRVLKGVRTPNFAEDVLMGEDPSRMA